MINPPLHRGTIAGKTTVPALEAEVARLRAHADLMHRLLQEVVEGNQSGTPMADTGWAHAAAQVVQAYQKERGE